MANVRTFKDRKEYALKTRGVLTEFATDMYENLTSLEKDALMVAVSALDNIITRNISLEF